MSEKQTRRFTPRTLTQESQYVLRAEFSPGDDWTIYQDHPSGMSIRIAWLTYTSDAAALIAGRTQPYDPDGNELMRVSRILQEAHEVAWDAHQDKQEENR